MIKKEFLNLTLKDKLIYYHIFLFSLFFFLLVSFLYMFGYMKSESDTKFLFTFSILFSSGIFIINKIGLRLIKIKTDLPLSKIYEIINITAKENSWHEISRTNKLYEAEIGNGGILHYGKKVSIIIRENEILINVIPYRGRRPLMVLGIDDNERKFIENLKNASS
ncbi:hypothetical protein [uncultured Flavobacterium sp.]|uniref:hypothetical protein n=1 Tax=uncultured Flavobacterium sp. TaxID=165435 RepID=UPI0030C81BB5